jgi:hypothetical protein
VRATTRQSIWSMGLSCLSRSSNQINQFNQTDQLPATRREMLDGKTKPLFY